MKMALVDYLPGDEKKKEKPGPYLLVIGTTDQQYRLIIGWGKMRWDGQNKWLEGYADLDLLTRMRKLVTLTPPVEKRRRELQTLQDAIDRERKTEHPEPFYPYPVKMNLYAHQVRGADMALLTFGWIKPGAAP